MTPLELDALSALNGVRMLPGSGGKRFRRDLTARASDPAYQLTRAQARYLWLLCHKFRRQIDQGEVLRVAAQSKLTDDAPEGDYRVLARGQREFFSFIRPRRRPTLYEREIARGGGRLAL